MNVSERCLKFAAECEPTAKFTSSPENRRRHGIAWRRDGFDVLSCQICTSHWLTPEAERSGTSENPTELGRSRERKARPAAA